MDDLAVCDILIGHTEKDMIYKVCGASVRHAPELAFWQNSCCCWKDDFGVAMDNRSGSSNFIQPLRSDITMFTKSPKGHITEGFAWADTSFAVMDSDAVRLIK
jgi:hypothetical protein